MKMKNYFLSLQDLWIAARKQRVYTTKPRLSVKGSCLRHVTKYPTSGSTRSSHFSFSKNIWEWTHISKRDKHAWCSLLSTYFPGFRSIVFLTLLFLPFEDNFKIAPSNHIHVQNHLRKYDCFLDKKILILVIQNEAASS